MFVWNYSFDLLCIFYPLRDDSDYYQNSFFHGSDFRFGLNLAEYSYPLLEDYFSHSIYHPANSFENATEGTNCLCSGRCLVVFRRCLSHGHQTATKNNRLCGRVLLVNKTLHFHVEGPSFPCSVGGLSLRHRPACGEDLGLVEQIVHVLFHGLVRNVRVSQKKRMSENPFIKINL